MSLPVPAELSPTPRDGLVAPTSSNLAGAPADRREGRVTAGSRLPGSVRPMTTRYDSASPRLVAPSSPNAAYHFVTIPVAGASFLQQLCSRFGFTTFRLWIDASGSPEDSLRTQCGGLVTGIGYRQGRPIAVVWSDFRVNAASFGHANSLRLVAFLAETDRGDDEMPLVYFVNSAGISLMEGRTVFSDASDR